VVYTRDSLNNTWSEQATLKGRNDEDDKMEFFGAATILVQGDTIVVGAPGWGFNGGGSVYIFNKQVQTDE
jgi:hypothetical protein